MHLNKKTFRHPTYTCARSTRTHMHTHTHAHIYACTHTCTHTHAHTHIHAHTYTTHHAHTHTHTRTRTHTHTHTHAQTHTHTHTHTHTVLRSARRPTATPAIPFRHCTLTCARTNTLTHPRTRTHTHTKHPCALSITLGTTSNANAGSSLFSNGSDVAHTATFVNGTVSLFLHSNHTMRSHVPYVITFLLTNPDSRLDVLLQHVSRVDTASGFVPPAIWCALIYINIPHLCLHVFYVYIYILASLYIFRTYAYMYVYVYVMYVSRYNERFCTSCYCNALIYINILGHLHPH